MKYSNFTLISSFSYPDNEIALLLVEGEPVEGHGAGDGGLDGAPEVHPDIALPDDNVDHVVYQGWSVMTAG